MTLLFKRAFLLLATFMLLIVISACGETNTPSYQAAAPTTAPTPTDTPTTATSTAVIKTATATVSGKSETILTDAKGMTLYYFKPDALHKVACTGSCAQKWPPLVFDGGTPTAATTLPGTLAVDKEGSSNLVTYNDHYLYTFASDAAAGDTKGDGIGSVWYVATPDLAKA